jgi:hypothetical protein
MSRIELNQYSREAEVIWYERNGKYPERIGTDGKGQRYVIGDWSWNKKFPHLEEHIEQSMKPDKKETDRGYRKGYDAGYHAKERKNGKKEGGCGMIEHTDGSFGVIMPTIEELERLMSEPNKPIEILPDGSIQVKGNDLETRMDTLEKNMNKIMIHLGIDDKSKVLNP